MIPGLILLAFPGKRVLDTQRRPQVSHRNPLRQTNTRNLADGSASL